MMAFYGYKSDADDYCQTPYYSFEYSMASTPIQTTCFPYYPSCEFDEPKVSDYDDFFTAPSLLNYSVCTYTKPESMQFSPVEYHSSTYSHEYYEYSVNPSHVSYSVFHYTEPKLLQYDPALQDRGYISSETNFKISYSTQDFNAPEFKEYSPNPYGGGYDPITTYGHPLSPSDEICYPRSTPKLDVVSLDGFSHGSIPSPYGKDDNLSPKPLNNSKETPEIPALETEDPKVTNLGLDGETGGGKPFPSIPSNDSPSKLEDNNDEDDYDDGFENGRNVNCGDEREIQVHQISYGSGLESMDLCESIFGYWPCLAKREQQQQREKCREACDQESRNDQWQIAADYLFGNPMVYNFENYHYQQHNRSQHQSYGNSWLH